MDRGELTAPRARLSSSGLFVGLTVLAVAVFASGIGPRPAGDGWDRLYDVALYNLSLIHI